MSRKNRLENTNELKNQILNFLSGQPDGATSRKITRALSIPAFRQNMLWKVLDSLKSEHRIIQSAGSFFISSTRKGKACTGVFHRKLSGSGEVVDPTTQIHIAISKRDACFLVDGDLIEVQASGVLERNGCRGTLRRLVKRRETPIVGYYRIIHDEPCFFPLDPRLTTSLRLAEEPSDAHVEDVITIVIKDDRQNPGIPVGLPLTSLGARQAFGVQSSILAVKFQIRENWSQDALAQAESYPEYLTESDHSDREDLRNHLIITVDPHDARDFDDGLSLAVMPDGYHLGVHIADVSHFVQPQTAIDVEAYRRGTSVYFPERAIHMLPERLAANLCSLRPDEDRLAITVWIHFSPTGERISSRCSESIIRSKARLTYADFQSLIDADSQPAKTDNPELRQLCIGLKDLFNLLHSQRVMRGVLDLDIPETLFRFDDAGEIKAIEKKNRGTAEQAIEEFMIAANIVVAEYLDSRNYPHLRRFHEVPDLSTIQELKTNLARLGIVPPSNPLNPDQVRSMLSGLESTAVRSVASYLILRSMKRAIYTSVRSGHFGLALNQYTQFTSPIRRYPDLMVHRALKHAIHGVEFENSGVNDLETQAKWLCERERRAQEAEWEAQKLQKIRFMQRFVGSILEGSITHIEEFGVFVELDDPFVEGCIPLFKIRHLMKYDHRRGVLISKDRSELHPGSRVKVQVDIADMDRTLLDFSFAS